ncbi:response regulator transcription factor [Acidaminobacter sp. JC074]|uniref:response regulator transcription factor n=1 Tax=Acidaminobacter sp. JC074 TaxID=2530199 RepID=UPI001F110131|nr:response regulator transcription factor [Acidaminobacter sp. JC074]MCH4887903.1 response regulator transcription factor [Acidaminobacter sp. JC074]
MKNILIIEDDKRMNEIITDYFDTQGYKVFTAFDGHEGLELFSKESIDLVILDIMMPKLDGWSVCRKIRQTSDAFILILSARSDEDDKLMGYELGADEYITKPFSPKVLVARVNAIFKRMTNTQTQVIKKGPITVDLDAYKVTVDGKEIALRAKEFDLFVKLIANESKVFSREALISTIWGYDYFGDGRIIDTNIKTLRKKISPYASYIQTVINVGYKFEVKK